VPLLAALLLRAAVASATPPPISEAETTMESNVVDVEGKIEPCSKQATREGAYGYVEIVFDYGAARVSPRLGASRGLAARHLDCVRKALRHVSLEPVPRQRFQDRRHLTVGAVRPLFPKTFLAAWQAAVRERTTGRGGLVALLPPEVRISRPGCLHFRGPSALSAGIDEWLRQTGGEPVSFVDAETRALRDGWWIAANDSVVAERADDDQIVDMELCLDRVGAAVSALRRDHKGISQLVGFDQAFDVEWVVDPGGHLVGEVGFCMAPDPKKAGYAADEIRVLRARVTARLRALAFGERQGLERVVLHYGPADRLRAETRPTTAALGPGDSAVEARCDARAALVCARERPAYSPSVLDKDGLARCGEGWRWGLEDLAFSMDISPDGRVDSLDLFSLIEKRRREGHRKGQTVPASVRSCLRRVVGNLRFPDSPGGRCYYSAGFASLMP
jgi:hypothetical protein